MGFRDKLYALTYDRLMASTEAAGLARVRSQLLAEATGDVLEIGAGTGGNLSHYGPSVETLTLTEPDPSMFRRLERTAGETVRPTTVRRAPAEDLPFADVTSHTVVSTLVLCGVDDQSRAVDEIRRVLRADGRLLLVEHVRSGDEELARRQDRMNWLNRTFSGCDCNRPTAQTLRRAGFMIGAVVESELPNAPFYVRPMIVGTATCGQPRRTPRGEARARPR